MASKPKKTYITLTARGTAKYPHLVKPDTKFKTDGEYKVDLIVPSKVAQPLIEKLTALYDEGFKESAKALSKKDREAIKQPMPFVREKDDEGEPTGNIIFKLRKNAKGKNKDGEVVDRVVPLADSLGRDVRKKVKSIYGGSELIVAFNPDVWTNAKGEVGLKLYIVAVQIVKLVAQGQGGFQFGQVEGGFTADDAEDENENEDNGETDVSGEDEEDF